MARVPTYHGRFGPEEARRLLWRAGFGPRPGEAERLAKRGLNRAVESLVHPKSTRLKGPAPRDGTVTRSRPVTPGATTTAGGWTGWSARRRRWSSA